MRKHTGDFKKCDICNKSFANNGYLVTHKRIHTGERPFQCDLCNMAFVDRTSLRYHTRTHTKEKPYKCEICDKTFSVSCNLKRHKKGHSDGKNRPFKCKLCASSFTMKRFLSIHMKQDHNEKKKKTVKTKEIFHDNFVECNEEDFKDFKTGIREDLKPIDIDSNDTDKATGIGEHKV